MRNGENGVLVTPAEAAHLLKVAIGTLYRWAHEDKWRKFGARRTRHWKLDEVQDAYDRRRGEPAKIVKEE